jgi:6-phosphogluconolactonase
MTNFGSMPEFSRREFIKATAGFAAAHGTRSLNGQTGVERIRAYVGTYTGAAGSGSNGEGIYRFESNALTGELSQRALVAKTPSPSWIAIHPSRKYLYAVNEVTDFNGNSGSVSAFAIDEASGRLTALNTVSSEGGGPTYLSLDAAGKFAFVANYVGGSIAVLPILATGALGRR